jgi:hypothetical protein
VSACAGLPIPYEPDVIEVTLSAQADRVKTAVMQTLTEGGYSLDRKDDANLTTGHREKIRDPRDSLFRRHLGTGRSRVDAM